MMHSRWVLQRTVPGLVHRALHYPANAAASNIRLSWSKEIMNKVVPFTGDLIGTNQISFEGAAVRYYSDSLESGIPAAAAPRHVEASWVEIILPFSDHLKLRNDIMLSDQKTIRYGKLFEILDSLAADVAMRHAGGREASTGQYTMTIVTAAVDTMHIYRDIDVLSDVVLRGYIGHVGSSSMEVCIDILNTSEEVLGQTMFIMVARDPATGKAVQVPKLDMDSADGKNRYLHGELRAKARKQKRASSLSKNAPMSSEIELIHSLYLQSVQLKKQKDAIMKTPLSTNDKDLSEAATIKVNCANRPHYFFWVMKFVCQVRWMKDTVFKNVYLMYPQDRNLHGNIFGGHILRRAFEAARVTASIFFGTEDKISFQAVDEIQFVKPVPVGSIVEFTSRVTYSEMTACVVNVMASTVDVLSGVKDITNSFNYMFSVPIQYVDRDSLALNSAIFVGHNPRDEFNLSCAVMDETILSGIADSDTNGQMKLPKVVPREYFEIVYYLEGRRSLRHMLDAKKRYEHENH